MMRAIVPILQSLVLGGCASHHLSTADKAHDRMAYARAAQQYEKVLRKVDDRGAALRAADSYLHLNQPGKAAAWFDRAGRTAPLSTKETLDHGRMLQQLGRNEEAMRCFLRVLDEEPDNEVAQELLLGAGDGRSFMVDSGMHDIVPLPLQGMAGAFSALPYKDGIIFVGEREGIGQARNPWTGLSFLDLFTARPTAHGWTVPMPLHGDVNGRFHEGPFTFSPDGTEMYFTRSDYLKFRLNKDDRSTSHLMLFRAALQSDGTWGDIRLFNHTDVNYSTGHPALGDDGNTLYFISDRPGGIGGTDIYRCSRLADGGWGIPENLGSPVNTPGNEMFPTVSGDTLFFSSNGHRSMGGLDIFRTEITPQGWSVPQNMNQPINSPHDDFSLVMLPGSRKGYLSSNRGGRDAVHAFELMAPRLLLEGMFYDDETLSPLQDVEVRLLDMTRGEALEMLTGPEGKFTFPLKGDTDYRITGRRTGKLVETMELSTQGQRTSRTWREAFTMHDLEVDNNFVVENIYYDYDSWEIRPDAAKELDKLVLLFNANPDVSFELSAHTDSRASHSYNLVLSDARAQSAMDYLVRRGVAPSRISAVGRGEEQLLNACSDGVECPEELHQQNRRTELRITGIGGNELGSRP